MPAQRYLLQVTVDIDPEREEAWNDWYNQVHVPDIMRVPGFLTARRFRAVRGPGPRYTTIYDIEGEEVVDSVEFNRARGWYEFAPFVKEPKVTVYREVFSFEG